MGRPCASRAARRSAATSSPTRSAARAAAAASAFSRSTSPVLAARRSTCCCRDAFACDRRWRSAAVSASPGTGTSASAFSAARPRRKRRERVRELARELFHLVAHGSKARGGIVASRRLQPRLQARTRRGAALGLRRLLERLSKRSLRLVAAPHARRSSFVSTPERAAIRSSSAPTVRADSNSFAGSASPSRPRRRRMSATPCALAVELALADRNVPGGVVAAAQLAPCVDARRDGERGRIVADPLEFVLERPDRGLGALLLRRSGGSPRPASRATSSPQPAGGDGRPASGAKLRLRLAQRRQMRQAQRAVAG